jgi:hypothetical protein
MRKSVVLLLVIALAVIGWAAPAEAKKKAEEPAAKAADAAPSGGEDEKKKKKKEDKAFADVIEDYEEIEGLFTFYRDESEGKVFMAIRPEQFDTTFLCSLTRDAGDNYFFDSGAMMGNFPFELRRVGKTVQFIYPNIMYRADKDTAIHRAIEHGMSDTLVGAAKIESAAHPDTGAILVNPSAFFLQDVGMVGFIFKEFIKQYPYSMDKKNSHFGKIESFPENTEIDVVLRFQTGAPKLPVPTIPDERNFRHIYRWSLSTLPETDFKPRLADDRVGHFLTMHQDYTSQLEDTAYVRYVNRWHLEKAEGKFEKSKPRQPIVFWLENTIPVEYRDAVREGILVWNTAFEAVGFKDAVEVHQQPDDAEWSGADVRYNTIRWIVSPGGGYAVGPSRTNPFTGQIYDADIRVSADMIRNVYQTFEELTQPVALGDKYARELGILSSPAEGACDMLDGATQQAGFGLSLISARTMATGGTVDAEQYLHDFIVHVIAHEVGHTLGLRHNFKASTIHDNDQLQTAEAASIGLTGSVMDYTPVNLAAEGETQGAYWQTVLGPYDMWAIEYAYAPHDDSGTESEAAMLARIASKVADPMLTYATDEDAWFGPRGMDPTANRWDFGADPIAYHASRIELAEELWSKIEGEFEQPGERYQKLRQTFGQGLSQYFVAALNAPKYVGGMYHYRDHVGDPDGRLPFKPVPADRQREALALITDGLYAPDAFDIPPSLLDKLAPERFGDFTGSVWRMSRLDYPVHAVVRQIQSLPLNHLYNGMLMSRMLDIELRSANGGNPLTLPEMFGDLREAIWAEVDSGSNINSFRRSLQRDHLSRLVGMIVNPAPDVPEDACTLARADLKTLQSGIEKAMSRGGLDAYTAAHLDETAARIEAALDADIQRKIGG